LGVSETPLRDGIPVSEYIRGTFVPLTHLAHGWEMHSAVTLTPAEDRTLAREPAHAVPASVAERLGKLRVLVVPYVACARPSDLISFSKPAGETHSAVWVETPERIHLVLPCRELDAHDTGLEFLASIAELLRPRLREQEMERFAGLLESELRTGVTGEIDQDALRVKRPLVSTRARRHRSTEAFARYRDAAFVSSATEYMHGLWHDVEVRVGPDHLPFPPLRRRLEWLAELFPPNPGYRLFSDDLEKREQPE
jgi:hypothetical protein